MRLCHLMAKFYKRSDFEQHHCLIGRFLHVFQTYLINAASAQLCAVMVLSNKLPRCPQNSFIYVENKLHSGGFGFVEAGILLRGFKLKGAEYKFIPQFSKFYLQNVFKMMYS